MTTCSAAGSLAQTSFRYLYESGSLANPQLTVQVTNSSGVKTPNQFDLSLVVDSATAKFNLARLDAVGLSGIGNVAVEGDILTSVSSVASAYFSTDTNPAGVQLPLDNLAGVAVRDFIPSGGYINAASIQGIAAGLVGTPFDFSFPGVYAPAYSVQSLLTSSTKIVKAASTFRVPFSGNPNDQVGFFLATDQSGRFNWANLGLTIQNDVTVNAQGAATTLVMNAARGSDVALIQVGSPYGAGNSQIQSLTIRGDGASITTFLGINGPIISSGPLGDLNLFGFNPVGNITASSIFGTITSYASYKGTIQTTGLWTDPITGLVAPASADFGRVYLNSSQRLTTTTLESFSGNFSGQLIIRGNLITKVTVDGTLTGSILAQENIGTIVGGTRLGGITVNGNDQGTILALGQIDGNLTINGNLGGTGSIVVEGGIIGSTTINGGMANGSRIISGGAIGSSVYGTGLTVNGNARGLIVSYGNLIQWGEDENSPRTFANVQNTPNEAAIDSIFAGSVGGQNPLTTFDSTPGSLDLANLNSVLSLVAQLHVNEEGTLSVDPDC